MFQPASFQKPDTKYGPLQIVHDFQFVALNLPDEYLWSADTSEEEKARHVEWRLKRLAARGYGGVVLNADYRRYLTDDAAWARLARAVDTASALGLRVWLYDEQYYPSGSAGGLTLRGHPEYEAQALACVTLDVSSPAAPVRVHSPHGHSSLKFAFAVPIRDGAPDFTRQADITRFTDAGGGLCWDCPGGGWRVFCFFTRTHYEGTFMCRAMRAPRRCVNVCDDRAIGRFLDVTFGPYQKWLGNRLGTAVEAVFTDEPSMLTHSPYPEGFDPAKRVAPLRTESFYEPPDTEIPLYPFIFWSYNLEEQFHRDHGYDLKDCLPRLFYGGEGAGELRVACYQTLGRLFDGSYSAQYAWRMAGLGMRYSGHMLYEEAVSMHPHLFGDVLRNLGRMDIPGCDLLYSRAEELRYAMACKLASSAAHGYGRAHVMIEASNMVDRDQALTLKQLCCAMAIEFAHGVDTITSYYGENLFTEEEYGAFTAYTARLGALVDGGAHVSQALVYYPFRQLAKETPLPGSTGGNEASKALEASWTALGAALLKKQLDFDIINDETLLKCEIQDGHLLTPGGETPSLLLFPAISWVDGDLAAFIRRAAMSGMEVAFAGLKRTIDGLGDMPGIRFIGDALPFESHDLRTAAPCPELLCLHKRFPGQDVYLLVNTGAKPISAEASIPCPGHAKVLTRLDFSDGSAVPLPCREARGRLAFGLALGAMEAVGVVG